MFEPSKFIQFAGVTMAPRGGPRAASLQRARAFERGLLAIEARCQCFSHRQCPGNETLVDKIDKLVGHDDSC